MRQISSESKLLFADPKGTLYEHPWLLAAVRAGDDLLAPPEEPVELPAGARLCTLPGRRPVGRDPQSGQLVPLDEVRVGRRTFRPLAVGAVMPPGWTRSFLPAYQVRDKVVLPQWAYTAAAWRAGGQVTWAVHTDRRGHWSPDRYSTPDLPGLVHRRISLDPENAVLRQLATCALEYRCFTAQNVFYGRDEGAIPASTACNARCVGCISEQEEDSGTPPSHFRIVQGPSPEDMAAVALRHLENAGGRTMVSFGQGCEGEPLTRAAQIEAAIRTVRARTARGSVHINTNGSRPAALERLLAAGLDSVRISLNSASDDLYQAYYRPIRYGLAELRESVRVCARRGAYVALNLLTFPGVNDREGEIEALCDFIALGVHQVQTRPLCIDPEQYLEVARGRGAAGRAVGLRAMLRALRRRFPRLSIGNFSRGLHERAA